MFKAYFTLFVVFWVCIRPTNIRRTFYSYCSEVDDISFIEALYRVLSPTVDQLRSIGSYCEKTASAVTSQ
jgi:hypothetical protein